MVIKDIPDLLEGLRRAPNILSKFVATIPEQCLDLRRGSGFWTIAEHVSHLAQVQPMPLKRLNRFMTEDHPEFVPNLPGKSDDEPGTPARIGMAEALSQFERDVVK
ncbi:MAG: DinB family protein [Desulfatitalea sp.]